MCADKICWLYSGLFESHKMDRKMKWLPVSFLGGIWTEYVNKDNE